MITPNAVVGMSESEAAQSQAFENAIDAAISEQNATDPMQKSFKLDAAQFDVTAKVREHTLNRYRKAKWLAEVTETEYVFTAPERKHGGRKKGSKNKPKIAAVVDIVSVPVAVV